MSLAPPLSHRLVASKSANGGLIGIETDMKQGRILVVEDDDILRSVTQMHLTKKGCSTAAAADAIEALRILEDEPQDLVICDIQLPGLSGLDLLKNIRVRYAGTEVVVITGFGTVVTAVEAMKSGAYDYLTKPIHLYDLSALVDRVLERIRLIEEVRLLRINIDHKFGFDKVIGRSKVILGCRGSGSPRCAKQCHSSNPGRDGNRKGSSRKIHPLQQPSSRTAVCHHQLRCHSTRFSGIGAFWSLTRGIYRRRCAQEG